MSEVSSPEGKCFSQRQEMRSQSMKLGKRAACFLNVQHLDGNCLTVCEQRQRMRFFLEGTVMLRVKVDGPFKSSHVHINHYCITVF